MIGRWIKRHRMVVASGVGSIARPVSYTHLDVYKRQGLTFDALVQADQLTVIATLADRYPSLSIVLDHAGKPPFAVSSALALWSKEIQRLANRSNVSCKLSGLITELHGCLLYTSRCV